MGDATPIDYLAPEQRYIEKLATPDVTIADIIGDLDPIKAARGGHTLASELTIHYGLLPRANRGIFAINELPDLSGKIQVGLFNIMQEGDVQIKGYPVRLPLDVALVFTANPEDYTARGKIITPLKDRIGSEIRTHYPATLDEGLAITAQEAWTDRKGEKPLVIPQFIREIIEAIAFEARADKRVDKRSGVSQRMPITCLENTISSAECRALKHHEAKIVPRPSDIYASMPSLTGKLELEYEGELRGADTVAREVIRQAIAKVFKKYFDNVPLQSVVQWFELGGTLRYSPNSSSEELFQQFKKIQNLLEKTQSLGIEGQGRPCSAGRGRRVHFGRTVRAEAHQPQRGIGLPHRTPPPRAAGGGTHSDGAAAPAAELGRAESRKIWKLDRSPKDDLEFPNFVFRSFDYEIRQVLQIRRGPLRRPQRRRPAPDARGLPARQRVL